VEDLESALHFNLPAAPPGARHPRATGSAKVEGLAEDPVGPRGELLGGLFWLCYVWHGVGFRAGVGIVILGKVLA
jgi:hypothetical protein